VRDVTSIIAAVVFATVCRSATGATSYVDDSVAASGDGTSWDTAFKMIQEGIDAASHGDTVVVAEGVYAGASFKGKNIMLVSTNPRDPAVVARTIMDGNGRYVIVDFEGTEDETCVLSGFTVRNGYAPDSDGGAGIWGAGTHATVENNVITDNRNDERGGGIGGCHGLIQNNIICNNLAGKPLWPGYGGGLYFCDGTIRNNTVVFNGVTSAWLYVPPDGLTWVPGEGSAMYECRGTIQNCIFWGHSEPQISACSEPISSLIGVDPQFVDSQTGDFRLRRTSPCIDAGFNDPDLPEVDIAGMPRIMYGGKSFTVDIGAYEFFYTGVQNGPGPDETTLVWSFVPDKTYSIFYSSDLLTWHLAIASFPSSGNTTSSWIDDGTTTGVLPSLVPRRFYRLLENP